MFQNGSICLEVIHGIRFLDFWQCGDDYFSLVKVGLARFISSPGYMISIKAGGLGL